MIKGLRFEQERKNATIPESPPALASEPDHEPHRSGLQGGNHRRSLASRYSWIGAALGLGAPVGLTLLRRLLSRSRSSLRQEIAEQGLTYSYLATATPAVFSLFGRMLGRHEDKLRVSHAHIERLREEFAAVVAHDLRNPISAIVLQLDMLLRNARDGEVTVPVEALRRLQKSGNRLGEMVNDLLDATRIEASCLRFSPERVSLTEAVSVLLDQIRPTLGAHLIELKLEGSSPTVRADPTRLDQIVTNLVENAAKYAAEGTIIVRIRNDGASAALSVEDQGPGISPVEIPRLFDRFYQAKRARGMKTGLGLGLYITKGLVDAHGGQITVESELGHGSTFTVRLPTAQPH
jgi:signal transduction histidine kinase